MPKNIKKNIGSLYKIHPDFNKDGYFLLLDHDKKSRKVQVLLTNANRPPVWFQTCTFHQYVIYEVNDEEYAGQTK